MLIATSTIINTLLIAWVARRIVGAPVGWPRTIAVSLVVGLVATPLLGHISTLLHLPSGVAQAQALSDTQAFGYLLVVTLVVAWLVAAEVAFLTLCEALVPTTIPPDPLTWLRGSPARLRRIRRYGQILRIAARHGLASFLRSDGGRRARLDAGGESLVAARVRAALVDGGVTFVKLGQTLATRADLLPSAYLRELSQLHSEVPPEPWSLVQAQVEAELGRPIAEVFASVEEEPLAAASVAQVHIATLLTGEEVALKVQRASARAQVTADLDIVLRLGEWAQRRTRWGARIGARELARGFARALAEELDYRVELANMAAIARTSAGAVRVPRVWTELSTSRLIVMERVDGTPLSRASGSLADLSVAGRADLATELFDSVLRQVVVAGVFHADLHPGNILLSSDGRRLTLLDFGSVGHLDRPSRECMGMLLRAVDHQDALAATDALIELLGRPETLDDRRLERDLGQLMLASASSNGLIVGLIGIVVAHGFSVPPMVAAAFRAIGTLDGSLRLIDPGFDLMAAARARSDKILTSALSPQQARDRVEAGLIGVLPMLQRLPRRIDRITADLESGRLLAHARPLGTPADRAFLRGVLRELTTAILCATLTLCGVALIISGGGAQLVGEVTLHGYLGATLLLFGFVLGARLLVLGFLRGTDNPANAPAP